MTEPISERRVMSQNGRTHKYSKCRHCITGIGYRSRGLCYKCWSNIDIRNLYPAKVAHLSKGVGIKSLRGQGKEPVDKAGVRLPSRPTKAAPGTNDKLKVLISRAARGVSLHHPKDKTMSKWFEEYGEKILKGLAEKEKIPQDCKNGKVKHKKRSK